MRAIGRQQQLRANFEAYLDGFSPNVQEILEKFRFRNEVPRLVEGGIEGFLWREVLPYAADAWYVPGSVKVGYEISFTRYVCRPQPLRVPEEIWADIRALEQEAEGLLAEIRGGMNCVRN